MNLTSDYFAAANTANGFFSLFGEIFSPDKIGRIYILKGGPGCGKSTLMKRISEKAVDRGFAVENYFCSSSPSSFDGVIIPRMSVAIADGTAPHTIDASYPAVCETIVDLGCAWRLDKAREYNSKIRELNAKKRSAYSQAYHLLSLAKRCRERESLIARGHFSMGRLYAFVDSLCNDKGPSAKNATPEIRRVFTEAISCQGLKRLHTLAENADLVYLVSDYADLASELFERVTERYKHTNAHLTVSLDPLDPEKKSGVLAELPDSATCFCKFDTALCESLDAKGIEYRVIDLKEYADLTACRSAKQEYTKELDRALTELSHAGELHDEIEAQYRHFTDFSVVEGLQNSLEHEIFDCISDTDLA